MSLSPIAVTNKCRRELQFAPVVLQWQYERKERKKMAKTATLTVRIDAQVKREAQEVLKQLGLTTTQAISMYLNQIRVEKALPYHPHIPNAETLQAMDDLENRRGVKTFETVEAALAHLGI
jgi:DNA-damage-inducible protein J